MVPLLHGWEGGGLTTLALVVAVRTLGAGCEGGWPSHSLAEGEKPFLLHMRETPGFITARDSVHVLALDSI